MKEILLILFGYLLALIQPWYLRKRRLKAHWSALRAELQLCEEHIQHLAQDGIRSPLYRLPLHAYEASFPVLMAEGAISEAEVSALSRCFGLIKDINRGLDNAADAYMADKVEKLQLEYDRNLIKVRALTSDPAPNGTVLDVARGIVDAKIA